MALVVSIRLVNKHGVKAVCFFHKLGSWYFLLVLVILRRNSMVHCLQVLFPVPLKLPQLSLNLDFLSPITDKGD